MGAYKCSECDNDVNSDGKFFNQTGLCPYCGSKIKITKEFNKIYIIAAIAILFIVIAIIWI